MQAPRSLRGLVLVLAVVSATACGMRAQTASPPLVATPVRPAASAQAPAEKPPAAAVPASTTQAYSPTPMSPPVTVKTGAVMTTGEGPIFIAMEKGYFRDEGIENVMQEFAGPQMMGPLAAGQIDVAGSLVTAGLFNAVARDIPLRIVADKGSTPSREWDFMTIMIRRDLIELGQVKDYSDLKGLTVGLAGTGGSTEVLLAKALEKGGGSLADVNITIMGLPDQITAFANKAIDVAVLGEPFVSRMEALGVAVRWRGVSETYGNQQIATVIYGPNFVNDKPEVARRWMTAFIRGARDYNDAFGPRRIGRDEAVAAIAKYTAIKDPKDYELMRPTGIDPDGKLQVQSIRDDFRYYQRTGQIEGQVDLSKVIDTSFQEYALLQLGPYER